MATFGKSGFCCGIGGGVKVGLAPSPIFSIFVVSVTRTPMLYPLFSLITMWFSSPYSERGMRMPS